MTDNVSLKEAGLKVTLPRVKVLEILERNEQRHLSAEDVYKALLDSGEEVGLATVYRVLSQFEAVGLVTRHYFDGDHCVFERAQALHHDHLVCTLCGRVDEFVDDVIEARQELIAEKAGFKIRDHALNIYGSCQSCQTSDVGRTV